MNDGRLLLDTHIWVNYLDASPLLRPGLIKTIETHRLRGTACVSVISVWEIGPVGSSQTALTAHQRVALD